MVSHEGLDGLLKLLGPPGLPAERLADRMNRASAETYDVVVCTTRWAAAEFRRLAVPNLVRVPRGVDLETFTPERYDAKLRATFPPVRCSSNRGRLSPEKHPDRPIAALAELRRRGVPATLGVGDPRPGGGWRGWAALLAEAMAPCDELELGNYARCGALVEDVVADQPPRALAQRPAYASVLPDPGRMLRVPEIVNRPLARRVRAINAVFEHLAVTYGAIHLDLVRHPAVYDPRMWGAIGFIRASVVIGFSPGCSPIASPRPACRRAAVPTRARRTRRRARGRRRTGWRPGGPAGCGGVRPICCRRSRGWSPPRSGTILETRRPGSTTGSAENSPGSCPPGAGEGLDHTEFNAVSDGAG